jgi:hypothetical protein
LRPGDIADIREIRESQRRLMRTGVFERQDPAKMPQIKFSRPEDGESSVVTRGGVRKVRGQSPDGDWRQLDVVVACPPADEPPTIHLIERGEPRQAMPADPRWPLALPDAPLPPPRAAAPAHQGGYYERRAAGAPPQPTVPGRQP